MNMAWGLLCLKGMLLEDLSILGTRGEPDLAQGEVFGAMAS